MGGWKKRWTLGKTSLNHVSFIKGKQLRIFKKTWYIYIYMIIYTLYIHICSNYIIDIVQTRRRLANQIEVKYQPHQFCMTWLVTPPPRWGTVVGPGWKRLHNGQRNLHESPEMRTTKPPIRNRHSNQWYPMVNSGLIKPYISCGVC